MARFILLLLLLVAGALVIALFFDHRSRQDARFDRLRQAFLHGRPLAGYSRPATAVEVVHPDGVQFRAPASWVVDVVKGERPAVEAPAAGGRRVQVEVIWLQDRAAGPIADALKALEPERERSLETLPNGHVLAKSLVPVRTAGGWVASYTWRLARSEPGGGLRIAVFRLQLPVEAAPDVIAQSDLGTLEREVREATFSSGTPSRA